MGSISLRKHDLDVSMFASSTKGDWLGGSISQERGREGWVGWVGWGGRVGGRERGGFT